MFGKYCSIRRQGIFSEFCLLIYNKRTSALLLCTQCTVYSYSIIWVSEIRSHLYWTLQRKLWKLMQIKGAGNIFWTPCSSTTCFTHSICTKCPSCGSFKWCYWLLFYWFKENLPPLMFCTRKCITWKRFMILAMHSMIY